MGLTLSLLRYAMLPGLKTRIHELFLSGFQYVPYFIAIVYEAVRLLPANHPYLIPSNIGRYGVRHVIGEAANNLVMSRKNMDQVILFFTILVGMMICIVQVFLLALTFMFQPAMALGFGEFFLTRPQYQANDLAGMMLDMIFGVPGIFNSCVSTAASCLDANGLPVTESVTNLTSPLSDSASTYFPFPIHQGLHQMFQLYSIGLLVVGAFITMYFIITVLAETAESGTPFGKRFNKVWAPLRFVAAFGLLVPVGYGLNSSQYIVLYAAKFGSGFASNGWILFNDTLSGSYLGQTENLVSTPNIPEVGELLQFFYIARTCYEGEKASRNKEMKPYLVRSPIGAEPKLLIQPGTTYDELMRFADGSSIVTIRFGEFGDGRNGTELYGTEKGFVKPYCGELKFTLTDARVPGSISPPEEGPKILQQYYWKLIKELWYQNAGAGAIGEPNYPQNLVNAYGTWYRSGSKTEPDAQFKYNLIDYYQLEMSQVLTQAVEAQANSTSWQVPAALKQKGWAGAGIWYNRVAELNGTVTTAIFNIPAQSAYPEVMENVRKRNMQNNENLNFETVYDPVMAKGRATPAARPQDEALSKIYLKAFKYWHPTGTMTSSQTELSGNTFIDAINLVLGTEGLFSMRRNTNVHPLAQLVGIGRGLIEHTVRNLTYGGVATLLSPLIGNLGSTAASLLITVAMIGLTVGFVLFYVVPFLPFIYFFFAIGGWFKGIFEALLGAPLWALAHLRIDGNGFSGQAASQGYYLIFEIFLRPILIVFGLLASITIFGALVTVLNETFDLVVHNMTGFDMSCERTGCGPTQIEYYRSYVDQFFYTIVYAVIVYIMGMASFKLIDQIPNNILRWMGSSAQTFNDQRDDAAAGLVGTASVGAQQTLQQLGGGLKGLANIGKK